ncbi:MAG: L-threonylcarbamoyladenylate synthase [Chloroflexi bacterium]|nr:L-threonylcarbamoyladenylate synthase [Chloroflexota bacterium]
MQTKTLPIQDPNAQAAALALLAAQQIIAAPTDTVYGLMCRYDSAAAIELLYEAKQRPPQKAIPVLIGDPTQLALVTPAPLSPLAQSLMARFWPGPLTLVLPALATLPAILTAGQPTVAVRMPDHTALCQLIELAGPLAATSANISGGPDSATVAQVLAQLDGHIPLVLADDESERTALPSTIVDLTDLTPRLLRPGPIAEAVCALLQTFGHSC